MATSTKKGREFAHLLAPYIGVSAEINATCSLIARHAATLHRYAEIACNREMTTRETRRVEQLEARVNALVASLPLTDDGPLKVIHNGDPRGFAVKVKVPNAPSVGNTWGLGGEFGV